MLTLKHFIDRPSWAAAAGYDFNYMDCMSFTATLYDLAFSSLWNSARDFPYTEVRELPFVLVTVISAVISIFVWPLIFWIAAFPVWLYCRLMRRRYQFGGHMTETAKNNIEVWKRQCEKKWRKKR